MKRAFLKSIFHPSDFSEASEIAFVHALRIALDTGAKLNMLHVTPGEDGDWSDFPGVRAALERWELLPAGSPPSAVGRLGIDVSKAIISSGGQPVRASLQYLEGRPADLIVLAVHQYDGRMRWLEQRVGEPIARRSGEMTLFIPYGVPGFVSRNDGAICLQSVLVPIAKKPRAQPAVEAAAMMIRSLRLPSGTMHLLHVGPESTVPSVNVPPVDGWSTNRLLADGDPAEVIVQMAEQVGAGLIVMTTEGPHGFLDALRGSTSERVLRRSSCPVVSLPAHQWLSRVRQFWTSQKSNGD